MTARAIDRLVDTLRAQGKSVKDAGTDRYMAQCPAHDDTEPSLSIALRRNGDGALIKCHVGCEPSDIVAALGWTVRDLFDEPRKRDAYRARATYAYSDGRRVHRKPTAKGKTFPQSGNTHGNALFRAENITPDTRRVYVPEGEKDVLVAESEGVVAVCSAMGAGKAHLADWSPLDAKHVTIVADRDDAGMNHAHDICEILSGRAASISVVQAREGKDLADHITAGYRLDDLVPVDLNGHKPDDRSNPLNNRATAQPRTSSGMPTVARLRRILDEVAKEVRARGLVGEEKLAQTLYLVLTSRLLDKLVSAGVKGHSASGKSYTVETVLRMFPPEAYLEFTAMSERALVYSTDDYAHRTIIIYEVTALREGVEDNMTSYLIRSLLSEGRIDYEVTIRRKDGGFTTKRIVKEGPTNIIFTTTKTQVHAENETRILSLATDDSREQTSRVLLEIAGEANGGNDLTRWHELQRWIANGEHRVTIPYATTLAKMAPPVAVRLRRDFGSILALIRAHAVLHQATRERDAEGRIVATLDDYEVVRDLVAETIAAGVGATVPQPVRETVQAVAKLATPLGVMAQAVAKLLRLDKSNVSRRLRMAADNGYVRNLEDRRGKPGRWVVGDPLPESVALLPDPAQLATGDIMPDLGGCAVALDFEGKNADLDSEPVLDYDNDGNPLVGDE